jgi:hypothetical protein
LTSLAPNQLELLRALARHDVEFVRRADGIGKYANWLQNARPHEIGSGLVVIVAAAEDVVRSKEASGRDKDRAALPQMRRDFQEAQEPDSVG